MKGRSEFWCWGFYLGPSFLAALVDLVLGLVFYIGLFAELGEG